MKIPYQLTAAVSTEKRREQILDALKRGLPRLEAVPIDDSRTLHIACYGPSLRDTYRDLGRPILSMSGATRFLHERGITPDYHLELDPRVHSFNHLDPPIPGPVYLVASHVAPIYFDTLKDQKVVLWHAVSTNLEADCDWIAAHDKGAWVVSTGSNVGLASMQVGGLLGFRRFEIHGMDGSFADDGVRHAGAHHGKVQPDQHTWAAGGKVYKTNQIMSNGVAETINTFRSMPIFGVFHGEGLTQALIEEANLPNAARASDWMRAMRVRSAKPIFYPAPFATPTGSPWEAICKIEGAWVAELQALWAENEKLRAKAAYNTGSIPIETGLLLRGLCAWRKPDTIVEIGTFIGNSTAALQAGVVLYTCDRDNDCVPSNGNVIVHPGWTSTRLLSHLKGITVDLFFFDGRLVDADIPLVLQLSRPDTVYAFDDYNPGGKGMANVEKLRPYLPMHGLLEPYKAFGDRTTLAAMIPPA